MASWTLGKIFAVDEEKEATQDPSDDDDGSSDSEEDDEDVLERQAAFNKNKQNRQGASNDSSRASGSIRRYDEYGDFISRSERARNERMGDSTATASVRGTDGLRVSHKPHRVSFANEADGLQVVHEVPRLTDEEKDRCFMTTENWVSIDSDIDLTTKRWGYHMEGRLAFDEDNNTIRGIEDMIFHLNKNKPIMKHRKAILEEVVRQKTTNEYPDWAKLSAISETSSAVQRKMAIELGKEDEQEKNRIWAPKKPDPPKKTVSLPSRNKKDKKSKRKGSFFGLFKKK